MGTATGTTNFFNSSVAPGAGGALIAKDFEIVAVVTGVSTGIGEMLEGGATNCN